MKAIILAAGVGNRLAEISGGCPKCLLEFNGVNLLTRHVRILENNRIPELLVVTGYRGEDVSMVLAGLSTAMRVSTVHNPDFRAGSILSLYSAKETLRSGDDIILMDADVLYHPDILKRLIESVHPNCFLLDRDFMPGPEPVKLCVVNGRLVEFRKHVNEDLTCDFQGESVGFFKFSPDIAAGLVQKAEEYINNGKKNEPYEEIIRDLLLEYPGKFSFEDVTGYPWLEIDFPDDMTRAREEILPQIEVIKYT